MKHLLEFTAERAWRYRQSLHDRTVAPTPEAVADLRRLDEPLPEAPTDPEAVIALLDDVGSPATMGSAGGRFFGFVVGSSLPAPLAANWLAGAWDQNAGIVVLSPIAAKLEAVAMRWMLGLLGLPPECGAGFVTCVTQANFAGLAAARHALLARQGWDVETRGLFGAPPINGFADANSWATDAHKWLNVPYDSGIVFVRDPRQLHAAMAVNAPYLVIGEAREPEHYTPDFSRRARGVEVWAALRSLGRQGLADLIERTCRHAARFAAGLRAAGYAILNDVVINQVLVSFGDAETTRRVIAAIQAEGTCWAGATVWQGRTAMRISVSSWATTDEDVERSLEAMIRVAAGAAVMRDFSPS